MLMLDDVRDGDDGCFNIVSNRDVDCDVDVFAIKG